MSNLGLMTNYELLDYREQVENELVELDRQMAEIRTDMNDLQEAIQTTEKLLDEIEEELYETREYEGD